MATSPPVLLLGATTMEWVELGVGLMLPITLLVLGYMVQRAQTKNEHRQWVNQKVIERRLEVLKELGQHANDLYCYLTWNGGWKEMTPIEAIAKKRKLDQEFYVNRYIFSRNLSKPYREFIDACFMTNQGANLDAKLRTSVTSGFGDRKRNLAEKWQEEWEKQRFTGESVDHIESVSSAYNRLVDAFRDELEREAKERRPTTEAG